MPSKIRAIILVTLGCCWLAGTLALTVGGFILRETGLGFTARFLDKLPSALSNPIFLLLWFILLFGWAIPLGLGFKLLFRSKRLN